MKIARIQKKEYHGTVYNFGVVGDESYTVEGVKVSNCRGTWVPIYAEEEQPDITGIPKSIVDSFDTVDGRPRVNAFQQLKKPINAGNKAVQELIRRKLDV